jgi:UPF0042 nucleotide-binding protein
MRTNERGATIWFTGMSGAGRSTTANVLEALGWLVVDTLPPQLLSHLAELRDEARARNPEAHLQQVAVVVDVRAGGWFSQLEDAIGAARARGERPSLVFLDATDEALVRRRWKWGFRGQAVVVALRGE